MFEQAFKNIDDVLWKEAGCTTELDYTEQTSWLLFLKYLDELEQDRADEAELGGKKYAFILQKQYRWDSWAAPKGKDGKLDHNKAQTGDDLCDFVNQKLFPYLTGFKQKASGPNTIEYKIGEIFGEIKNKISSGYNLREIIDHIDELRFRSQKEKHELSHLYEAKIKNMGNAGRNGGEYYTPRPLIRAMVKVVKPKIGERIYDGACGSAGFLCESFEYLTDEKNRKKKLTTRALKTLQGRTFYGKEKKSLAYVIAIMNMILHGIEAPNIIHTNTLTENLADIQDKDRFHVVLANPPFGGKERKEVQQNFPIRTGETAFLFLQHFIKMLKAGGRGGVVIKNTFLSNTDNASTSLRKLLLESCNLHTVLDCPGGTFLGAGVKTVVLFFEKGAPTRKVWFYQLDPGRNMGKTNPLNDDDLTEFVKLQKKFGDSDKSWSVDAKTIDPETFDLSVKNPNGGEEVVHRSPQDIMDEIAAMDAERGSAASRPGAVMKNEWNERQLGEVLQLEYGKPLERSHRKPDGRYPVYGANGEKTRSDRFYFDKPSIIVGRKGSAGELNLTEPKFWPLDVTYFVTFDEHQHDLRFLYYLLTTLQLPTLAKGVKPGINRNEVYAQVAKVPDTPEQRRIVGILDEAFDGIATAKANAEKNLQNARALFESHLNAVCTQRADGWVETTLGGQVRFIDYRGKTPKKTESGLRLITAKNVKMGYVQETPLEFVAPETYDSWMTRGIPQRGDVLFTTEAPLANVAQLDSDEKVVFAQRIITMQSDAAKLDSTFLKYLLLSKPIQQRIHAKGTGATVKGIKASLLKTVEISFPQSVTVQGRIVTQLDALSQESERLESIYQRKLDALDELKKSLLHQAFNGQL